MKIVFWSNVHGQTGTTSNTAAIATYLSLNYRFKILLMHNEFYKTSLDHIFLSLNELKRKEDFFDIGIDALMRYSKYNKLTKSSFSNYTTTLIKDRLDLLRGTQKIEAKNFYQEFLQVSQNIYYNSEKFYDFIITDASGGFKYCKEILDNADIIVINLNQNICVINDFFDSKVFKKYKDKCIYLFGSYNGKSRYNLKNICRKVKYLKEDLPLFSRVKKHPNIGKIPYNIEFLDASNKGDIISFFYKNKNIDKNNLNYDFFKSIDEFCIKILEKLKIKSDSKVIKENLC